MITEDYCSFEIAKLLKEKGFDSDCNAVYDLERPKSCTDGKLYFNFDNKNPNRFQDLCAAPTFQMAMKWLREVHKIFIYIEPFITTSGLEGYKPYCTKIGGEFMWINPLRKYSNTSSDTYEEAVEAVLEYCLTNLI